MPAGNYSAQRFTELKQITPANVKHLVPAWTFSTGVLRGMEGFGRSRYIRTGLNIDTGSQLPMAIEIIDAETQINRFLSFVSEMFESGLVTLERVRAIQYPRQNAAFSSRPSSPITSV